MTWLRRLFSVTLLNLQTLRQRLGSSLVAVIGIAGVVMVFVAVLSIAVGFQKAMSTGGADDTAIVLRSGSDNELTSGLLFEETRLIAEAPGILKVDGQAAASPELFVIVTLPKTSSGTDANVPLRGVTPRAFDVHDQLEIIEGRNFEPGRNELIVGRGARLEFANLEVGSVLELGQNNWTIVGAFSAAGTVSESELWCDAKVLQPAYRRGNTYQSVLVKLSSPAAFDGFKDALTTDPRLNVRPVREQEYYASQSQLLSGLINSVGGIIGFLMGLGAIFGAVNTMYTAVSSRIREIATLRALGFTQSTVLVSVMLEALFLALVGGLLGGGLAFLLFNGYHTATMNWQSFSQVTFGLAVTPELLVQGIFYALVMGFLGGLLPAVRAARMPVATALREL